LRQLQSQKLTANYEAMPRGSEAGRTTETLGLCSLGHGVDEDVEAVRKTVEDMRRLPDGKARLQMVDLCYWKQSHNYHGVADVLHVSESTVRRWNREFVYTVAKNRGLWR
jgi:DNA-directed RNA polymerase specialized sigma subunit